MKLNTVQRIQKEDLAASGELPGWIDALLTPLNNFITQLFILTQNNVTLSDNVGCNVLTLNFKSGVPAAVTVQSSLRVTGIVPMDASGNIITGYGFTRNTNGTLGVVIKFTDASGNAVTASQPITIAIYF